MSGGPLLLDAVGLGDVEQALANHRDDQVLRSEDAKGCVGTASMCGGKAVVYGEDVAAVDGEGDGGAFAGAKAPGGEHGSEEPNLLWRGDAGFRDGASSKSGGEALLLIGIAVGDFRGDMVGGKESVGVAGEQSVRSMRRKLIRTDASVTMIAGLVFSHDLCHSPRAASARVEQGVASDPEGLAQLQHPATRNFLAR